MPVLNYSTRVRASQTISEIQTILSKHGARRVQVDYEDATPVGLTFRIKTSAGERSFRLPVRIAAVRRLLERDAEAGAIRPQQATPQRAVDVAWRIVKDWIEAQMALVDTEMVTTTEIFLPYLLNDEERTLFEVMQGKQFLPPGGGA